MIIACVVSKATHCFLRIFGKGATSLPGKIALLICPELLGILAKDVNSIAITGTNGKTTSARMTETALKGAGLGVFSNKSGANLIEGITASFVMNTNFLLKPRRKWAVIECDEAASLRVMGELKPKAVLITNLFKDQSDRYGDVNKPAEMIYEGLKKCPDTVLAVNADCQLVSYIAERLCNEKVYFGLQGRRGRKPDTTEETRCAVCGGELRYSEVSYSNLGEWRCIRCGRKRQTPRVLVRGISEEKLLAELDGERRIISAALPGEYNRYNTAGMLAAALAAGIPCECALAAAESFERGFGRMEEFPMGQRGAELILVKNTAAVNQTLDYIKTQGGSKTLVFLQNARAGDGKDLSWLYDAEFEKLRRIKELDRIICGGECGEIMQERIEKTGLKCEVFSDCDALITELAGSKSRVYLLPSYTAMLELRARLVKRLGGRNFWE